MIEPRVWPKRISRGRQIAVPVELLQVLDVEVGDSVYLVLWEGQAILVAEKKAAPHLKEALVRAGVITESRRRQRARRQRKVGQG